MPVRFECEACEARIRTPDGSEGARTQCPQCGFMQQVPEATAEELAYAGAGSKPAKNRKQRVREAALGLNATLAGGLDRVATTVKSSKLLRGRESDYTAGRITPYTGNPSRKPVERTHEPHSANPIETPLLTGLSWTLRVVAFLLLPGAVKAMLVVHDLSGSAVVASLAFVTGVAICAALLALGEISALVCAMAHGRR